LSLLLTRRHSILSGSHFENVRMYYDEAKTTKPENLIKALKSKY